jgi:hypothetical protein
MSEVGHIFKRFAIDFNLRNFIRIQNDNIT